MGKEGRRKSKDKGEMGWGREGKRGDAGKEPDDSRWKVRSEVSMKEKGREGRRNRRKKI